MLVPVLFPMNMKGQTDGEIKGSFLLRKKDFDVLRVDGESKGFRLILWSKGSQI
jgi:hypothetical protein